MALRHGLGMDLIPESVRGAVRRRSSQICGAALLTASLFALTSMVTWTASDPSLSNASGAEVKNLLGRPGAIVADLLMQGLGLASLFLLLPLAYWGWRLLTYRPLRGEQLRAGALTLGVLGMSALLSALPTFGAWPVPTGLGGVIGDLFPRLITVFRGGWGDGLDAFLVGGVGAVGGLAGLYFACRGSTAKRRAAEADAGDDEDEEFDETDRRLVSLGALTHTFLSAKARLFGRRRGRAAGGAKGAPVRAAAIGAFAREVFASERRAVDDQGRVEPRLNAGPAHEAPALGGVRRAVVDEMDEDADMVPAEPAPRAAAAARAAPARGRQSGREGRVPEGRRPHAYRLPDLQLLGAPPPSKGPAMSPEALQDTAKLLEGTLDDFGVRGEIGQVRPGPVVTLYELEPAPGIKSSRVIGLADDIARSMSAISARVAVVPGRNAIGIELPNAKREKVLLRELLSTKDFGDSGQKLAIALGKTIGGEPVIVDLARMPHLLVAGTTGSGKSVAINTMILSLLYRLKPEQCRLIMVDPKMLELSVYDGIPHLLAPVVTDPKKAVIALKWAVREMEDRYKKMSKLGVRNIDGFNARVAEAEKKGESIARTVQTGFDHETGEAIYEREEMDLGPLPYIVVIVDEMADLMLTAGKEIEGAIQRLAQMARAAGIHLVMATQRPSVDVITGTIKANFPTRISFQVTSKIDSRTILGEMGAEQLLGQGDMLYMAGGGRISRVHGPFVSDDEVERVVKHLKAQGAPDYLEAVTADLAEDGADGEDGAVFDKGSFGEEGQDLYSQAVAVVLRDKKCSTSYIQRRLQIGYNRAASLVERMEKEGVVGAPNHAGKREILLSDEAAE
ncbi:DNA translocase FtsK 4TM domain-containing protein [Roseixanthobacter pseudopolyaromaticivorans]|uniref:DNA translocase FtsK 4TM domain-containing protein n=1 Tax=Roseixanthobacter pseudopolyaromaticivorans TaxID=3119920 RepID=UPI00404083A1